MRKILINLSIFAFALVALLSANHASAAWAQSTASAPWDVRFGHTSVVFRNDTWVLGGYTSFGVSNDIWRSTNASGSNWSQAATSSNLWSPRATAASVVFANRVWVMGGFNSSSTFGDVWFSTNNSLSQWAQATTTNLWPKRQGHAATVFNVGGVDKIFVSGGFSGNDTNIFYNDVWSSSDGLTWTEVTSSAPWTGRRYHQMVSMDGKLWVIGGLNNSNTSQADVWSSSDGATWTQVTSTAPWTSRGLHQVVVGGGKMWMTGGWNYPTGTYLNDFWSSDDGITWVQINASSPWGIRGSHSSVYRGTRVWVMGGGTGLPAYNDVWRS